jgi:hypothetical protein
VSRRAALAWVALVAWATAFLVLTLALGRLPGMGVGVPAGAERAGMHAASLAASVRYVVPSSDAEPHTRTAPAAEDARFTPAEAIDAPPVPLSVSSARASNAPPRVVGASVAPLALSIAPPACAHSRPVGSITRRSVSPARTRAALMVFLN